MKYIIGIGNPEKKYEGTRHNVGFAVVEGLTDVGAHGRAPLRWVEKKAWNALYYKLNEDLTLVKPLSYVNNTGETAEAIIAKENVKAADLLFVCDDANLDFGKLRLRASGSAGGHHGLESAITHLGADDFPRLRIGIRNPGMPEELPDFVLGRFAAEEEKILKKILAAACEVCRSWSKEDVKAAMQTLSRHQIARA